MNNHMTLQSSSALNDFIHHLSLHCFGFCGSWLCHSALAVLINFASDGSDRFCSAPKLSRLESQQSGAFRSFKPPSHCRPEQAQEKRLSFVWWSEIGSRMICCSGCVQRCVFEVMLAKFIRHISQKRLWLDKTLVRTSSSLYLSHTLMWQRKWRLIPLNSGFLLTWHWGNQVIVKSRQ